jgi:DNA-binding response OmpR family regulator
MEPERQSAALLIVEDNGTAGGMLCMTLDLMGYQTQHALTGREAVRQATLRRFDAAILDYDLPDTDGLEVARALRVLMGSDFPMAMVTGKDVAPLQAMVQQGEITAWFGKPFEIGPVLESLGIETNPP